jgi:hypothetical protein
VNIAKWDLSTKSHRGAFGFEILIFLRGTYCRNGTDRPFAKENPKVLTRELGRQRRIEGTMNRFMDENPPHPPLDHDAARKFRAACTKSGYGASLWIAGEHRVKFPVADANASRRGRSVTMAESLKTYRSSTLENSLRPVANRLAMITE